MLGCRRCVSPLWEYVYWQNDVGWCCALEDGDIVCGAKYLPPCPHLPDCPQRVEPYQGNGIWDPYTSEVPTRKHWIEALFRWKAFCLQYQHPKAPTAIVVRSVYNDWPLPTDHNPLYQAAMIRRQLRMVREHGKEKKRDEWYKRFGPEGGAECEEFIKEVVAGREYWEEEPGKRRIGKRVEKGSKGIRERFVLTGWTQQPYCQWTDEKICCKAMETKLKVRKKRK